MEFTGQLDKYIHDHGLFTKKDKLLIAVSGGVDSIGLAHSLAKLGYVISIAHCNFQLRGTDSDADETFVKDFSEKLNVPFFTIRFDTVLYQQENVGSIQMIARDLRYSWFENIRKENGLDFIITAHHQNDLIETVLFNLVRGTGLSGLHGILPKKGLIVRPFLFAQKETIMDYAQSQNLTWREDQSNQTNKYARNLIRNEVVPILKQLNPSLEKTVSQTSELIQLAESFIENQAEKALADILIQDGSYYKINIRRLLENKDAFFLLSHVLKEFDFGFADSKQVFESADSIAGKLFYSPTHRLLKDRDYWVIDILKSSIETNLLIEENIQTLKIDANRELKFEKRKGSLESLNNQISRNKVVLDYDLLKFPLQLRNVITGDRFSPVGLKGTKKVSDLMTDLKLNLFEKEKALILESNGEIAAILPDRPSNQFAVTKTTVTFFVISTN